MKLYSGCGVKGTDNVRVKLGGWKGEGGEAGDGDVNKYDGGVRRLLISLAMN